jgi:hypothetical protein
MDEVRDFFEGCREAGRGGLVFLAECNNGVLDLSTEFRYFGAGIVDNRTEGGNGVIIVVLVALVHRFQFEHGGIEIVETPFMVLETPVMVNGVRMQIVKLSIEVIDLCIESFFHFRHRSSMCVQRLQRIGNGGFNRVCKRGNQFFAQAT